MTSALLLVAFLVLVELSYRRWTRRVALRRSERVVDLRDATVIPMPERAPSAKAARRSG